MKRIYIGLMPPFNIGSASGTTEQRDPPVITKQPGKQSLYQDGGTARIDGAKISGFTSAIWQKKSGEAWVDTEYRGENLEVNEAERGLAGYWRLKAVNGNSEPTYSEEAQLVSVYLYIQNDVNLADPTLVKNSNTSYTWNTTPGGKYVGVYFYDAETDSRFTPEGLTGRAIPKITSSNTTVAPTTQTSAGQWRTNLTSGQATVTFTFGELSTKLKLFVS